MGCACKSNSTKKQVTQITKRNVTVGANHPVHKVVSNPERKQIVIRRPAR